MDNVRFGCDLEHITTPVRGNGSADPVLLLRRLLELGRIACAEFDLEHMLPNVMDGVIDIYGAERGMILLFDERGETLVEVARNFSREDLESPDFEFSQRMIATVRRQGIPMCRCHALTDATPGKRDSRASSSILSVMCLPLRHQNDVFGLIYLDHRTGSERFEPYSCVFFREFAEFLSLAAHHALKPKSFPTRMQTLEAELRSTYQFESIVGHHPKIVKMLQLVAQVAKTDVTVLIQGESGTGKELIARALHDNSPRKEKTLLPVNCAAIAESLLESELFGHVRGAFTGAVQDTAGWFEHADGSTIFLDEVNNMSLTLQVKLLRVLQTGEYSRVGSTDICYCDVRVIAASSQDVSALVKEEKFREELYYRLNIVNLWLLPLRDRTCDIPLLARHFITLYSARYGKDHLRLSQEAEMLLVMYDFPGNVRELENMIQRALILAEGNTITPEHLPAHMSRGRSIARLTGHASNFKVARKQMLEQFERDYLVDCLRDAHGNITRAARSAGIHVSNLHAKIKKYGLKPRAFKSS